MSLYIETISQFKPKNDANFPIADVTDLKGSFISFLSLQERNTWTSRYPSRLTLGQLCYVVATEYYYRWNGTSWVVAYMDGEGGNGNVYIQDTPPLDAEENEKDNTLWVDTSDSGLNTSNALVAHLLKMVNVLAKKVDLLEYMNQQIQSGTFSNNMYNEYDQIVGIDPGKEINDFVDEDDIEASSIEEDYDEEFLLNNTLLSDSSEPIYYKDTLPNVKHILIKYGTSSDMLKYKDNFLPAELLWCYNTKQLWIKDPKTLKLIQIGTASSGPNVPEDVDIDDVMKGILQKDDYISAISFVDMVDSSKHYDFSVLNGELTLLETSSGQSIKNNVQEKLFLYNDILYNKKPYFPTSSEGTKDNPNAMLFINMVYSGGNSSTKNDYNPCNYNFIELSNLTNTDLNLDGLYLHYTEGTSRQWITLPLKGCIKSKSTYLIKGAKCGQDKFSKIKVGTPDMYWSKSNSLNPDVLNTSNYSVWDSVDLLKFADNCSFFLSGKIALDGINYSDFSQPLQVSEPWLNDSNSGIGVINGFIDLVGFGQDDNSKNLPNISTPCSSLNRNSLWVKYYSMDNVSQAFKGTCAKGSANSSTWTYINLNNTNADIDLEKYTPKNSKEGKSIFFNKNLLKEDKPTFVTCTFGYNPHTTRCFTWVSKGYRDEYLMLRQKGDNDWIIIESFKSGDGRSSEGKNWDNPIYDRIRTFTSDGTYFTVHKVIVDLQEPVSEQEYEYMVGYKDHYTDIKTFTLRSRQSCKSFSFVQVTDLQGFNAEEYETWRVAAEYINQNENIHFTVNTGDATQNGNRINEWIDYFKAGESLFNRLEQQYTVGNNDLCPVTPFELGTGSDTTKQNPINVQYFFTFEHPFEIPVSSTGKYIPCVYSFVYGETYFLCMNSELTDSGDACYNLFGQQVAPLYQTIKNWCISDLTHASDVKWKIAYCHESPFTLLIKSVLDSYKTAVIANPDAVQSDRGEVTSHMNVPGGWWFAPFLEDNKFNLCICGHKHTYSNSRYLRDNENNRMKPFVYSETETPDWLTDDNKYFVTIDTDKTKHFVKYVMCQATGYKVVSNKELPGKNIAWLEKYYPTDNSKVEGQLYPHYIVWNIGEGSEKIDRTSLSESRPRILGEAKKLYDKTKYASAAAGAEKQFNYNTHVYNVNDIGVLGGNGDTNPNNYIIVEKLFE